MSTQTRSVHYLIFMLAVFAMPVLAIEPTGLAIYEDSSREQSFNDVRQEEFHPTSLDKLNFGTVPSAFWIRVELDSIPDQPLYLRSCFVTADELDVYIPEPGGWREIQTGDTRPFTQRDVAHRCYVFDLSEMNESTLYIRTYGGRLNRLPLELIDQQTLWQQRVTNQFGFAFYFAVLVSMIVYNFFLFLVTRDSAYFYYVGYLGSITLFLVGMSGYAAMYLWPNSRVWVNVAPIFFAITAVVLGSRFVVLITDAERHAPRVARLLLLCLPLAALTLITMPLKGPVSLMLLFLTLAILLGLAATAIIIAARNGHRPAYVMVVAAALMIPGALIYSLNTLGLIEEGWLTANILYITSAVEAMILSVALAYRIESLNQEIEQRENQVNQMRARFSRQLIQTADNERRALARELHDGMGQGLLAVKNLLGQMGNNAQLAPAVKQIRMLISDSRNLARNMHPQQIENLGFATALKTMLIETIQPCGIELELNLQDTNGLLCHDTELQLYRIAQECASNIVRHSKARHVNATLSADNEQIVMKISDDGVGIADSETGGIGLFNMQERAAIIGAVHQIQPNHPNGTTITISLTTK